MLPPPSFTLQGQQGLNDVREIAEWASLDKTALWHTRLAAVLLFLERSCTGALLEYQQAIEKDPKLGAAHFGASLAHAKLQEPHEAIIEMQLARSSEGFKDSPYWPTS